MRHPIRQLPRRRRRDLDEVGATREDFRFLMAFASEVIDGYGRLLCYLNRDQPRPPRPPSYNERLLGAGQVLPYFIWPNVDPFRLQPSLVEAVPRPGAAPPLPDERASVEAARSQGIGVWGGEEPLRLFRSSCASWRVFRRPSAG